MKHADSPGLGVPRTIHLEQSPRHPTDRPAVLERSDIDWMNARYGLDYYEEMHNKRKRARQDGV